MGCILAIDYGTKRIGLAISDEERNFAFPFDVIENKNFNYVLDCFKNIIQEKEIDLILVGIPYGMTPQSKDGTSNKKSMEEVVCDFVKKMQNKLNVDIQVIDEKLSSFIAEENLRESGLNAKSARRFVDQEAARLLLEEFIQKSKKPHKMD